MFELIYCQSCCGNSGKHTNTLPYQLPLNQYNGSFKVELKNWIVDKLVGILDKVCMLIHVICYM